MREFFRVVTLEQALSLLSRFPDVGTEVVPLAAAAGRVKCAYEMIKNDYSIDESARAYRSLYEQCLI